MEHRRLRLCQAYQKFKRLLFVVIVWPVMGACTFKFEVTSQRTALENQIIGTYREIDENVVMMASVRGVAADGTVTKPNAISDYSKEALRARQNQEFNRDDIDELKNLQVVGEAADGTLAILPSGISAQSDGARSDRNVASFAQLMVTEENRDRRAIWARIIQSNPNLTSKDLPEVQRTFAKMQRESAGVGHWVQDDKGIWKQVTANVKK